MKLPTLTEAQMLGVKRPIVKGIRRFFQYKTGLSVDTEIHRAVVKTVVVKDLRYINPFAKSPLTSFQTINVRLIQYENRRVTLIND